MSDHPSDMLSIAGDFNAHNPECLPQELLLLKPTFASRSTFRWKFIKRRAVWFILNDHGSNLKY